MIQTKQWNQWQHIIWCSHSEEEEQQQQEWHQLQQRGGEGADEREERHWRQQTVKKFTARKIGCQCFSPAHTDHHFPGSRHNRGRCDGQNPSTELHVRVIESKASPVLYLYDTCHPVPIVPPQWRAADAEIKVPSGENIELKRSPS